MFTGIVEEIGHVVSLHVHADGIQFRFKAKKVMSGLTTGNSIAVNGTCLTVVQRDTHSFSAEAMRETLRKTNLGKLRIYDEVNLERAISMEQRLGGHLVQGHVDATGTITRKVQFKSSWMFSISFPSGFRKYFVRAGSVAVDGVSLTVARLHRDSFEVGIIPFTMENTTFHSYRRGTKVNLEFDVLGKYIESLVHYS
jgi:riboflavin synthase